ncbi:MDR family NADP-dependent oxidoreductase [Yinghuangia seranimata]|uniref:MDR family NADP-dependent oxidoreductase n=1 Tax=Yinghuangia seranimata TaxID=408067 RepID=UPI00248AF70B|nr:NADP-dependent oxidoreductase [Yinghuangia seranimata]MDI2126513.1 NADP-dependent oxidoreductase [Yinghuangia seranimata]
MTPSLPRTSREVRLTVQPQGLPTAADLRIAEVPVAAPGPGEVLVRNGHFLVFPGLRTLMGDETGGLPLPPLRAGDTLFGPAVGEVVAAGDGAGLRPGETVVHLDGWREFALLPATRCSPVGEALPDPVAHLSSGSAAYGALTRLAPVRDGDTVFVSGAAGATGVLAGQIARLLGAGRVVGSTGSAAKAERLRAEFGFDAVAVRGTEPFGDLLAKAAPEGVDVVVDTVGGEQLTAAVATARPGARIALVGALAGQLSGDRAGGSAPVEVDSYRLIVQGVSMRGYRGTDHPDVPAEWTERFGGWLREGRIRFPYVALPGIDRAPAALQELIEGRHFGSVVVKL